MYTCRDMSWSLNSPASDDSWKVVLGRHPEQKLLDVTLPLDTLTVSRAPTADNNQIPSPRTCEHPEHVPAFLGFRLVGWRWKHASGLLWVPLSCLLISALESTPAHHRHLWILLRCYQSLDAVHMKVSDRLPIFPTMQTLQLDRTVEVLCKRYIISVLSNDTSCYYLDLRTKF